LNYRIKPDEESIIYHVEIPKVINLRGIMTTTNNNIVEGKLFLDGQWISRDYKMEVTNKYTGEIISTFPVASKDDVDLAITAAIQTSPLMAEMPAHKRSQILNSAASLIRERREDFAFTIAVEAGKALKQAREEVNRACMTFQFAAEEAKRMHGETTPLDAASTGEGYFGFWTRRPLGVIAAISPFNFPLNLVAHKVAPAIAAGNTLVLKPASSTPLVALKLCQVLLEAGLPPGAINLVAGPGNTVGEWLITDPRAAMVTFTGSMAVGKHILSVAGIKKVTLELGNNSPVIIAPDADLKFAAKRCAMGAYSNAGQVCISVQRIYCLRSIYQPFLDEFVLATQAMVVGDPLDECVDVGPMIDSREVDRIESWIKEAVSGGAKVVTGAKREGSIYYPTILTNVNPSMRVIREEVFAPIVSVIACDDFEEAVLQADNTEYGLQAAVFTQDINRIFQAIKGLNFGGIIVHDLPTFRVDHMPYGGNRNSGLGREGVRFSMEEMTNTQMIAIRLKP
jgi:acyl-CoA reductase-like NAD-dependent aldehyde dehydrogenase